MEHLRYLERPELTRPTWIGAFVGWADAQEGASRAVRNMVKKLSAKKFAELDPEEFYDFTSVRPMAFNNERVNGSCGGPTNEFFYWKSPDSSQELILFLGTEPSLKWRTYTSTLLSVVGSYDMQLMVNLGSLLDALPHTREATLTGGANKEELKQRLGGLNVRGSGYQGPVGITSAFMDACTKQGLDYISIWGHAPHYVQLTPNYKVSRALVRHMNQLLGLRIPLDDLEKKGKGFRGGGHQGDLLQRRGQLLRQAAGEAVRRGIRSARAAHRGVGHRGCRGVPASGAARRWTLLLGQLTSPPGRLYHITLEAMEGRPAYTRLRLSPHRHTWDRPDVTLRPS